MKFWKLIVVALMAGLFGLLVGAGCNDDDDDGDDEQVSCDPGVADACPEGSVCEEVVDDEPMCFAPVLIRGRVFDLATDLGIEGALVVARDANGAAMGAVATSGADGEYELTVPVSRKNEQGHFDGSVLTLRVDAAGYASYPGGFRPSLPIDLDDAQGGKVDGGVSADGEFVIETPTTDVALVALPKETEGLGSISGVVPDGPGALVVAGSGADVHTGVADLDGIYTVFNVPAGTHTLDAYAGGMQYDSISVDLESGGEYTEADFAIATRELATVSGSVNIVNAPGGAHTSVVLVVEDTFNENFARGEVPPGLRAGEVTGAFTIEGVPDGKYVVLAAFENDDLVRDPDTSIGGTQIVHIDVAGGEFAVPESFKVTEALGLKEPGSEAPEAVSGTLSFIWADDSSEDLYSLVVYNAFGDLIWENDSIDRVTGSDWVTLEYGGPALETGMYYQWRATSLKKGVPISTTEDLRGLFFIR